MDASLLDPHAFLRSLCRRLAASRGFHLLAEAMQFDLLVEATALSEKQAALVSQYNAETRHAILGPL